MKNLKNILIIILVFSVVIGMAACGGNNGNAEEEIDAQQAAVQEATDQQATVGDNIPAANAAAGAETLIGSWIDINSESNFLNITKTDTGYQCEDRDGKYPAEFKDGVLKVKVSETDTADVYFDAATNQVYSTYNGDTTVYRKK